MSKFGWWYPPGCNGPPEEDIPPCCEECPEEIYENCPGEEHCTEFYFLGIHGCCIKHKTELFEDGTCGECMREDMCGDYTPF